MKILYKQCINGGEGGHWNERGRRLAVGKEKEIKDKLFFHCLNKLN